jgi:hypothetical protein
MPLRNSEQIGLIRVYESAANRHDVDACVALFSDDAAIEDHGRTARGAARIRDAHEHERACAGQIAIIEPVVDGSEVHCHLVYRNELDRLLDLDGVRKSATFVVRDGLIDSLVLDGDDDEANARRQNAMAPFQDWVRTYHPEAFTRMRSYDGPAGTVLVVAAQAWIQAGKPGS